MTMPEGEWCFLAIVAVILLFAVVSNSLVVFIVLRDKKMRNVTNVLICNLAISDILLGGFVLPQNLHDISHEHNFHEGRILCKFVNGLPVFCISSSIFTLVCISIERKKTVVDSPEKRITIGMCKVIVPLIWIFAAVTATPTVIEFDVQTIDTDPNKTYISCGSLVSDVYSLTNGVMLLLLSYVVPLLLICRNYCKVIRLVLKKGKVIDSSTTRSGQASANSDTGDNSTSGGKKNSTLLRKRLRIIYMLIIVAALFAISWLPYFVSQIIAKAKRKDSSEDASSPINLMKIFLATFSTAYNVILYVIFNNNFRKWFRRLFCRIELQKKETRVTKNVQKETPM